MEEVPVLQDMNGRGNRNKKKCRRRRGRQFEEDFPDYELYPANVTPTSGDSGVCLLEQGQDTLAMDFMESQKLATAGSISGSFPSTIKEEHPALATKEPMSGGIVKESDAVDANGNLSSDGPHHSETFDDLNKNVASDKSILPHADVFLENPSSPRRNMENVCVEKGKDHEQGDVNIPSEGCMKHPEDYIEESFNPYMNDCEYLIMPENFSGDWKKCNEDQFVHNRCFCNRSCQSLDWKFRPHSEQSVLTRLREAGAGDSIAQNMPYYTWTNDYPTDEERPDYLYVLESQGPGLVQNHPGQYTHPGGHPVMEQNYGLPYDQCLHIYRRDGPPRLMMGPNNFRPNCQMEEMPPMGRAAAWMEGPGNFPHPPPMGYFDAPVMDYMGPVPDLRRRGQQNKRFRQKRPRQPVGLAPIEECFDAPTTREQTSSDANAFMQNEEIPSSFANLKKSWPKKKTEFTETTEYVEENSTSSHSKVLVSNETSNCSAPLETNANFPVDTSCQEPCSKGYALAVCGLLGKHTGKTSETKKETCKQEENTKTETVNNKSVPYDKPNFKKCKGKPGRQVEDECNDRFGKIVQPKDITKETEKVKKMSVKSENSSVVTNDFVKTRTNRGKMICKSSVTNDAGKTDKINFETSSTLSSSLAKDSKMNTETARNNAPCQDEERVTEKKRKWKSVWTRRRETEIHRPEEKLTVETDIHREKEMSNHRESDRREGVPGNVPDILKQVENSELKSFWKESYEAPKPQRKTRPKRETRWRQGSQEHTSHSDASQNAKKDDATPVVTPVVKLDIVPAVEPSDKDNSPQDNNTEEQSMQQHPTETCVSEIGWYEETLAEDKDREDQREIEASDAGECKTVSGVKKNKSRKWKRKQRNNRKVKDEKTTVETLMKEHTIDTIVVEDTNKKKENDTNIFEEEVQTKSSSDGNSLEPLANNVQKDEGLINGFTVSEVTVEQRDGLLTESSIITSSKSSNDKAVNNETKDACELDKGYVDCCKSILNNILLNLPENLEDTRKLSQEVPQTEEKLTNVKDDKENVHSCSSVLNEVQNNNHLQSEIVEEEKMSKDNLKKNSEKDGIHHKYSDPGFPHGSSRSIGIPQPPPFVPRKKLLLRRCDNCNILEKSLGEYGECVRCKEIPTRLPRVYCNRMCQRADWKRRHRAEHKQDDSEENYTDDTNCAFI